MAIRTCLATWSLLLLLNVSLGAQGAFTDDPLGAGVTQVRAVHVAELRSRVNAVRSATGLPPFLFSESTLAAGITPVRAVHLGELRTAISEAYVAVGVTAPAFTDPGILQGTTLIRAVHISELRAAVIALEGGLPNDNEDPFLSTAVVTLANVAEDSFNDQLSAVRFEIANGQFSVNPDHVHVFHRGEIVNSAQIQVTATAIVVSDVLVDGPNEIELLTRDGTGRYIDIDATLWAGSATLMGQVVNESGQPIAGATVTVRLGIDPLVRATTTTTGTGEFSFSNVPGWTVTLEARAPGNRHASTSVKGDSDFIVLEAKAIGPPSSIDNNDFSQGTDGWEVGTAPVEIVPHEEDEGVPADVGPTADPDFDLRLRTFGEGAQRVSRTFNVNPGSRFVKVRYRFVTSEVPGGFFGTEFDDSFSVSVRSQNGQGVISASASMNSLGLAAFDANGATRWRETSLRVSELGDVVHVDVSVANVADALYDSYVVIDAVAENSFTLSDIELKDIDNSPLEFLSLSEHSYFGGKTRIHGELTIEGADEDATFTITLEVIQEGEIRAVGHFIGAQPAAVRKSVSTEEFEYTFEGPLFEIDGAQTAMIDPTDPSLFLVVRARTATGKQSIYPIGPVTLLVRFPQSNRFGNRNGTVGGDDWAQPGLVAIAQYFSSNTYGDFSNMNGGSFPPHAGHRTGNGVDGWFPGYNARDAAAAAGIIDRLNDPVYGSSIARVLVTFEKISTDPFWNAISGVVLQDGRRASDVIHPAGGYRTHFHWDRVTEEDEEDREAQAIDVARRRANAPARGR